MSPLSKPLSPIISLRQLTLDELWAEAETLGIVRVWTLSDFKDTKPTGYKVTLIGHRRNTKLEIERQHTSLACALPTLSTKPEKWALVRPPEAIMRHCKGCSHPTICDTHGCGAEEARRNRAREAQQQASGQLNACAHELLAELITCRHDLARLLGELRESVTVPGTDEIPDPDDASLCEFEETRIARLDALIARATGGQAINSPQGGKS